MSKQSLLIFILLLISFSFPLFAQETCPCENCPDLILDETIIHEFSLNIFNVQNNDLANGDQCVSRVGVKFRHEYLGDITMRLVSPSGQAVTLIGPETAGDGNDVTDLTLFDVTFVPSGEVANPDPGFDAKWDNFQEWQLIGGTRNGSYYPFSGNLEDFNQGRVNGTWILQVFDQVPEKSDEGELLDFFVEFCDSEGLVCDPCLDEEDMPDCIFQIDPGETTVVPGELFCLPVYAENVAFLQNMTFSLNWNPALLQFERVDSFEIEFLTAQDFVVTPGNLSLSYTHTFDTLGLVVKDSTPLFNVCYTALGGVGDSAIIDLPAPPIGIDVEGVTIQSLGLEGQVNITVDSTADCIRAIQLCDNSPISVDVVKGPGFFENEGINCFADGIENQSKWYRFDILQSGELELVIRPMGTANYGFSLYQGTCPNELNSTLVSCINAFEKPFDALPIGIASDALNSFGEANQLDFTETIFVQEGETYFLLIDNASSNSIGFNLEFGGTAQIGDNTLNVVIEDAGTLNCTNPVLQLNAQNSSQGVQYIPIWTTDTGQIDTPSNLYEITISQGGNFFFQVADNQTGCVYRDSVFIPTDQVFPTAEAGLGDILTCSNSLLELSGENSSTGDDFEYAWTTDMGNITNDTFLSNILVDSGGIFELRVTNTVNGCFSTDTVSVTEDFIFPQLSTSDSFISCAIPTTTLEASSTTEEVTFEWFSPQLEASIFEPSILVADTGFYFINVTARNGCTTSDSVYVTDNRIFPDADAGDSLELNCNNPIVSLDGSESSIGDNFIYSWTTTDGNFLEETVLTALSPSVDSGGVYTLVVTDTDNGCTTQDSVFVATNFTLPSIQIQTDTLITCFQPAIRIDASQSDSGSLFDFEWFVSEHPIVEGENTYQPTVNGEGEYILTIENTANGCRSSELVQISEDNELPVAILGESQTVNCSQRIAFLDATGSSEGAIFSYSWRTQDGHFIADTTGIRVGVDSAGTYQLAVFNQRNGCETVAAIEIFEDFVVPDINIPNDSTLTCDNPSLDLNVSSNTPNTNFTWLFPDGTSQNQALVIANEVGQFSATVTASNGCTNTASLFIDAQQDLPNIVIENPNIITCAAPTVIINAQNSDTSSTFIPLWTSLSGNIADGTNSFSPSVDAQGTYLFQLTNTQTGCVAIDSVFVPADVDFPVIEFVETPSVLTCTNTETSVLASANVSNPIFQWKLGETVLSEEANLIVDAPGDYNVRVINPLNNCSSRSTITIEQDIAHPIAEAGPNLELNCTTGVVQLSGDESSQGTSFVYLWTTQGSENISNDLSTQVDIPGLYSLLVVDQSNGCRSIDTVRVTESIDNPIANAGKDTVICQGAEEVSITLGGNNTSIGANFIYNWENDAGIELATTNELTVATSGIYVLQVTNTDNNCVAQDSVVVTDEARPNVLLSTEGGINCRDNEMIFIAESDSENVAISWVGDFEIDSNILVVTDNLLDEQFVAFAVDTITGCRGSSQVIQVTEDRIPPLIEAGEELLLNCTDTLRLEGQLLSQNIETNLQWTTENGNIVGNANILDPIVDAAGTYTLTIENTNNFCVTTDTITVFSDQILPVVELGEDLILTCFEPSFQIEPISISQGPNFYYEWRDENDELVGNAERLETELPGEYQLKVVDSTNLCANFDRIVVFDSLTPPLIEIQLPSQINCRNNQTELSAIMGTPNVTLQWSVEGEEGNILEESDLTSAQIIVDTGGIYIVEATNIFSGCSSLRSVTVADIRQDLIIEAGDDKIINCYNDTSVLVSGTIFTESENLISNWTSSNLAFANIDNTLLFSTQQPGTYYFFVEDTLSHCFSIDSLEIDIDVAPITFNLADRISLTCQPSEVIIGDLEDIGGEFFQYEWTTEDGNIIAGINQPQAIVDQAGLYNINILNLLNGCSLVDSQRVEDMRQLPIVDVGELNTLSCIEETITLGGINTSKGASFTYRWFTEDGAILEGENTAFAIVNQPGNYTLEVIDATNQCQTAETIQVLEDKDFPEVSLPNDFAFKCTDESITIEPVTNELMENLEFRWTTLTGQILSREDEFIIEVGTPGTYFLRIGDKTNSCVTIDTLSILDERELPQVANIGDQMLACNNESIRLEATGSATGDRIQYEWLNDNGQTLSNNAFLNLNQSGIYLLRVTNTENSCVNTDTFLVTENINPPNGAELLLMNPTCSNTQDGVIEILEVTGGTTPFSYQINQTGQSEIPVFESLPSNEYQLTITDGLGCTWDTTLTILSPPPIEVTIVSSSQQLIAGDEVTFSISTNIEDTEILAIDWAPSLIFNCQNCRDLTTTLNDNTSLSVTITDINGCTGSAEANLEVSLAPIPSAITPNGDGNNDNFIIPVLEKDLEAFPNNELIIFNRWGDVVYQITPYANDWTGINNAGQRLPEGTYYYILRLDTREGEVIKGDITILR